jgi:hypothetical protein
MLDYLATHLDATIRYHASNMILNIHSDASYLSVSNARSRLGGLFLKETSPPSKKHLTDPSSTSLPSSKTWWLPQLNPKLERAFTTPKVEPRSESRSPSWATHNPQRLCERITPLHTASLTKESNKNDQRQCTCDAIGSPTESAKNNSTFIGAQDVKISQIITQNIIQRNITKMCAT